MLIRMILAELFAVFISNIVFSRTFGFDTAIISQGSTKRCMRLGLAVTVFTTTASLITCTILNVFLEKSRVFKPLLFVVVLSAVYMITMAVVMSINSRMFRKVKWYMDIAVFNCVVLGAFLLSSEKCSGYIEFTAFGISAGLGFLAASGFVRIAYEQLKGDENPAKDRCAILAYVGVISMALYSFIKE